MVDKRDVVDVKEMEKAKYMAFKSSFLASSGIDDISIENIKGDISKSDVSDFALNSILGMVTKELSFVGNKNSCDEINMYYSSLLEKIRNLASEFGLTNSLEISNLFSYLLWMGYLSKTGVNQFKVTGRKFIDGLYFADIMDGVGVCFNHADMLKDLLNTFGFNAACLFNGTKTNNMKFDYKMPIERKSSERVKRLINFNFGFKDIFRDRFGNHAFVLIRENNRVYIYDATNLCVFEVSDAFNANLINGKGISELHPYFSFTNMKDVSREIVAFDGLFELDDLSSLYSRKDFIMTSECNIEMFNSNICLLDDFYIESFGDISKISEITDCMVKSKRKS